LAPGYFAVGCLLTLRKRMKNKERTLRTSTKKRENSGNVSTNRKAGREFIREYCITLAIHILYR
jgi:hypothetical protein